MYPNLTSGINLFENMHSYILIKYFACYTVIQIFSERPNCSRKQEKNCEIEFKREDKESDISASNSSSIVYHSIC